LHNLWIINEHLTTPALGKNGHSRHYILAQKFLKQNYNISLITGSFSINPHVNVKQNKPFKKIQELGITTFLIKAFKYQKSHSKIRVLNWFIFSLLLVFIPLTKIKKPDIIIVSSTPMLPMVSVQFLRLFYPRCKVIFETRDLWPLTPLSIGGYSEKSFLIKVMAKIEAFSYNKADYVVSVLKNSYKRGNEVTKGIENKFKWISNGVDVAKDAYQQKEKTWYFEKKIVKENSVIIGYAGTLGKANAMEFIIEAFNKNFKNTRYYLVILGDGGEKSDLIKLAEGNPNIFFEDSVSREYVNDFYQKCDFLYLSWRDRELYKYGIAANKIFEYMFAAKPILMSANIPDTVIELSKCGILTKAENPRDIKDCIVRCAGFSDQERDIMGKRGKKFLLDNFTYDRLASDYLNTFEKLITSKSFSE